MAIVASSALKRMIERLTPRQRQYATLAAIMTSGVGVLWAVFSFTDDGARSSTARQSAPAAPTNIGVMAPGHQVNPIDQWVGTAGRKLAQYERERDEQSRINRERKEFEDKTMQRFSELERRLTEARNAPSEAPKPPPVALPPPATPTPFPPPNTLPSQVPPLPARPGTPPPMASSASVGGLEAATLGLVHVSIAETDNVKDTAGQASTSSSGSAPDHDRRTDTISTYLPVSFTRGILLGGLDAPTGGQAQSNPHPVLIRLSDNAVLPNRFRGEYRECFVIAAGYGDIGSERAYLRTENLSCVRDDGATLEVNIQGTVYGEDGKVGLRGRLVTKQGQMLANALLSGIASGIGQGLSTSSTDYSTSALGTVAHTPGGDATRSGLGSGVGRALDRLAQYYIKLAEQTFPVVEIDAGREIDVVVTKGVRIDAPAPTRHVTDAVSTRHSSQAQARKGTNDEDY